MNFVRQVLIFCILIRACCVCDYVCVYVGGAGRAVNAGLSLHGKEKELIEAGLQAPE